MSCHVPDGSPPSLSYFTDSTAGNTFLNEANGISTFIRVNTVFADVNLTQPIGKYVNSRFFGNDFILSNGKLELEQGSLFYSIDTTNNKIIPIIAGSGDFLCSSGFVVPVPITDTIYNILVYFSQSSCK